MPYELTTEPNASTVTITPEDAAKLLDSNTKNRDASQMRVNRLAEDIKNEEWQFNGEAIKVSVDGTLLDGQHRLRAVVQAQKPIVTLFITGLPNESQETMDTGMARNLNDVLKLRGEPYSAALSSLVRALWAFGITGVPCAPAGAAHSPTTKQSLALLDRHPDLRYWAKWCQNLPNSRWLHQSVCGTAGYVFSHQENVSEGAPENFFEKIIKGVELGENDPQYVLREKLVREYSEEGRVPARMQGVLVVKVWKAWRIGEPLRRLQYSRTDDAPKIDFLNLEI